MTDPPRVRVLGVRHHGPGSARAVRRALASLRPSVVLIEGPADADPLAGWAADPALAPPVALLAWDVAAPARSVFWPLAFFSPEWQALAWAAAAGVPARFVDLPSSVVLARPDAGPAAATAPRGVRVDPLARLAEAAGYDDPEAWWEDVVELPDAAPADARDPFDLITEAMAEVRATAGEDDEWTLVREAFMRRQLRAALREGHERVAVVCGAWHAPALAGDLPAATRDAAAVRGLPKTRTELTWVPWTHGRLAQASGYGAGVTSPGWYHHLFTAVDRPVTRWLAHVAAVLRRHDLPVSTAHVIEAVRLAEALGALRGRPLPGLTEVTEATWSVLCGGNPVLLDLVTREAVVGETLGEVPDGVPRVPLDADLQARARSLRLRPEATARTLTLDLRRPNDLAKSQLLRQLAILDIPWGQPDAASTAGTFKEVWQLAWQPEFAVRVVEAARHGNTVPAAAAGVLAGRTETLPAITAGLEAALLAGIDEALPGLLAALDRRAAHEADLVALLGAVPPLARVQRYGDVRRTDTARLAELARALLGRACAGLPAAASGLSDEAAGALRAAIDEVQGVIGLLDVETGRLWAGALLETAGRRDVPGLIAGRLVRLLLDAGGLDADDAARRLSRVLSPGTAPERQAGWVEGFLAGSPLLVIHDDRLLGLLDDWVAGIGAEAFTDVLPVLRRTFGTWDAAARRRLATRLAAPRADAADAPAASDLDWGAAGPLLDTVRLILRGEDAHAH